MKLPAAYRAIEILQRRAEASLAAIHARLLDVHARRKKLLDQNAHAKRSVHVKSTWSGFDCATQSAYTLWSANVVAGLAQTHRAIVKRGTSIVKEKKHWAACRVGLLRRAERNSGVVSWPA